MDRRSTCLCKTSATVQGAEKKGGMETLRLGIKLIYYYFYLIFS